MKSHAQQYLAQIRRCRPQAYIKYGQFTVAH